MKLIDIGTLLTGWMQIACQLITCRNSLKIKSLKL